MNKNKSTNATTEKDSAITSRRKFLKKPIYGSVLALSGCGVETADIRHVSQHGFAQQAQAPSPYLHSHGYKTLSFEHTHTGEKLRLTYFQRGDYIKEALLEINYLLRDFRTDDIYPIDIARVRSAVNNCIPFFFPKSSSYSIQLFS